MKGIDAWILQAQSYALASYLQNSSVRRDNLKIGNRNYDVCQYKAKDAVWQEVVRNTIIQLWNIKLNIAQDGGIIQLYNNKRTKKERK